MNVIDIFIKTLFFSNDKLSIQVKDISSGYFDLLYKGVRCGSLIVADQQVSLIYSRGLHLYKGLHPIKNILYEYCDGCLEIYFRSKNNKIIKVKCTQATYQLFISKLQK